MHGATKRPSYFAMLQSYAMPLFGLATVGTLYWYQRYKARNQQQALEKATVAKQVQQKKCEYAQFSQLYDRIDTFRTLSQFEVAVASLASKQHLTDRDYDLFRTKLREKMSAIAAHAATLEPTENFSSLITQAQEKVKRTRRLYEFAPHLCTVGEQIGLSALITLSDNICDQTVAQALPRYLQPLIDSIDTEPLDKGFLNEQVDREAPALKKSLKLLRQQKESLEQAKVYLETYKKMVNGLPNNLFPQTHETFSQWYRRFQATFTTNNDVIQQKIDKLQTALTHDTCELANEDEQASYFKEWLQVQAEKQKAKKTEPSNNTDEKEQKCRTLEHEQHKGRYNVENGDLAIPFREVASRKLDWKDWGQIAYVTYDENGIPYDKNYNFLTVHVKTDEHGGKYTTLGAIQEMLTRTLPHDIGQYIFIYQPATISYSCAGTSTSGRGVVDVDPQKRVTLDLNDRDEHIPISYTEDKRYGRVETCIINCFPRSAKFLKYETVALRSKIKILKGKLHILQGERYDERRNAENVIETATEEIERLHRKVRDSESEIHRLKIRLGNYHPLSESYEYTSPWTPPSWKVGATRLAHPLDYVFRNYTSSKRALHPKVWDPCEDGDETL